ncbi:MAG: hypothetical protein DRR06_19175 [Gammaproteobacteria bacterium]|nr:MAG: hypothetical protein DRR06_19175 [Gammaproteobacteria bacterium]
MLGGNEAINKLNIMKTFIITLLSAFLVGFMFYYNSVTPNLDRGAFWYVIILFTLITLFFAVITVSNIKSKKS